MADAPTRGLWTRGLLALAVFVPVAAKGQAPEIQPRELVRQAVQNEVAADTTARFMFRDQKKTAHLRQTRLLVETREATAGLLIEQDGHPISDQQRQAEHARLQGYIHNPDDLSRKRKQEKDDADHTERIVRALPEAFIYEYAGTEKGSADIGRPGDDLVRLNFRPDPSYDPPSRVEQVLTGMQGHLLIDAKEKRIAEIDGTLQKDVSFGWGFLGHLDRGGRFVVHQANIAGKYWELTRMELAFTGKILLFKKLSIQSTDVFSDFHQVSPDLTFAQGVELLEREAAQPPPESVTATEKVEAVQKVHGQSHSAQEQRSCCGH